MGRQVYLSDEALLTIRRALSNSWSWEDSLADAWGRQTSEGREATQRAEHAAYWMDKLFGARPVEVQIREEAGDPVDSRTLISRIGKTGEG